MACPPPYDKRHLLWFRRDVPVRRSSIPWLRQGCSPPEAWASRGARARVPLVAGAVRAAVLNCYEDTLPEASVEAASVGPNLLVNVTEDGWFGSPESELHARLAGLRAVELRRDLVRAVNGGISSWYGATGRLLARGAPDVPGVLVVSPALLDAPLTVYGRLGDAPWAILVLLLANAAVWRALRRPPPSPG